MKRSQNFFRPLAVLVLAVTLLFSAASVQAAVTPAKKNIRVAPFAYPGFRVYSTLASDNSTITLILMYETGPGTGIYAPAPTTFGVTIQLISPTNAVVNTYNAPIVEGYSTITHPTGLPSHMAPGGYTYRISAVSPTSYSSYPVFFDPTSHPVN